MAALTAARLLPMRRAEPMHAEPMDYRCLPSLRDIYDETSPSIFVPPQLTQLRTIGPLQQQPPRSLAHLSAASVPDLADLPSGLIGLRLTQQPALQPLTHLSNLKDLDIPYMPIDVMEGMLRSGATVVADAP